jgi:oxygen-independent coproporphyrinogen-3 oxidase
MHWGGGTPTYLDPTEISEITSYIKEKFRFSSEAEVSAEIDPRGLVSEHLQALQLNGFNRISMGVQDFNQGVLNAINRDQSESITQQVINWSRLLEISGINIDLIYGLPLQ